MDTSKCLGCLFFIYIGCGLQHVSACVTQTYSDGNKVLTLSCLILNFTNFATWSLDGIGQQTRCLNDGFCTVNTNGNYNFTSDNDGIYIRINPYSSTENGKVWKCDHPPIDCNTTVKSPESTGDEGNNSETWVTPLAICLSVVVLAIIITGICCLYNTRCNFGYLQKNSTFLFTFPKTALVVGEQDCLHVMMIRITIVLKLTECKLLSIKHLKWKKSSLTDKTKIRELKSTSNHELILRKITKEDEGCYWCEMTNEDGTSTKSGILTLQVVHDIVNVGKKSVSYSATIGDSIQILCTREISPHHIKFIPKRSATNKIAPEAQTTKIIDSASLLFKKISMQDEGCYQFESSYGEATSGVLILSVMEEKERYNTFYLGKSGVESQTLQPRIGAKPTLVSIEKNEVGQEGTDKKKKKKRKKNKSENANVKEGEVVELESQTACETTSEEKEIT